MIKTLLHKIFGCGPFWSNSYFDTKHDGTLRECKMCGQKQETCQTYTGWSFKKLN